MSWRGDSNGLVWSAAATVFRWCSLVTCLCVVAACGGGGGGGSGSDASGGDGGSSQYGVRVLHGAIDAAPVDLITSLGGSTLVSQATFAGDKSYRRAPSGSQVLSLTRAFSPSQVVATVAADVASDGRYSVLLYGDIETFGLRTSLIEDVVPRGFSGALVRFVNGATGASAVQASAGAARATLAFGEASEYLPVAPGSDVAVVAVRTADGAPVVNARVDLVEGGAYTFLIAGEVSFYVKGVLLRDE